MSSSLQWTLLHARKQAHQISYPHLVKNFPRATSSHHVDPLFAALPGATTYPQLIKGLPRAMSWHCIDALFAALPGAQASTPPAR